MTAGEFVSIREDWLMKTIRLTKMVKKSLSTFKCIWKI